MKRVFTYFVLVLLLVAALTVSVSAETVASGTCGDNLTWSLDRSGVLVISGSGKMDDFIDEYKVHSGGVTLINNVPWYSNCKSVKVVIINDGVTSIGDNAFTGCSNMTKVTIPDSVVSIGDYAFYYCNALSSISFSPNMQHIGFRAFCYCSKLTEICLPEGMKTIGENAFQDCSNLVSVSIPSSITSFGNGIFYGCTNLKYNIYDNAKYLGNAENPFLMLIDSVNKSITSCVINEKTRYIGNHAFQDCDNLATVVIPNRVTTIDIWAFSNCDRLASVTLPVSLEHIKNGVFSNCVNLKYNIYDNAKYLGNSDNPYYVLMNAVTTNITTCVIHDDTQIIGCKAFSGCTQLTAISVSDSVTAIGDSAFYSCINLISARIGKSVTTIDASAFYGSALRHVSYAGTQEEWSNISIGSGNLELSNNIKHYHVQDTPVSWIKNCENKGLFCSLCNDFLTRENAVNGTHTYTDKSDISCDDCNFVQQVNRIAIQTLPQKREYVIFEKEPDVTEGKLKVYYDDGAEVLLDMKTDMISDFDSSTLGVKSVTLTYEGFIANFNVRIVPGTPNKLIVETLPNKTIYFCGDLFSANGLTLTGYYGSNGSVGIPLSYATIRDPDMSTPGTKVVLVTVGEVTAMFEIVVYDKCIGLLDCVGYPESTHNYAPNTDEIEIYTINGAYSLTLTFSDETQTENGCDYIYLYDGQDNEIAKFTGTQAAGKSITIPGDTVKIRLISDDSVNKYGYSFSSITAIKTQHALDDWDVYTPATCTEDGEERKQCANCDYYETRVIEASGHSLGEWEVYTPVTCTENGEERNNCVDCSYFESRVIKADGHTLGGWTEYKAATCTKNGEERRNCANCSYYESQVIEATRHDYEGGVCIDCGEADPDYKPENPAYNGLVEVDGVWGYYEGGVFQEDYTGLVPYGDILFYVENGILDFTYTGLVWYQDAWRYVANSELTEGYTGLVWFNDNWFYTVDSVIDWTFTGLVPYEGNYFYVQNNLLDWSYTSLGYHEGNWYFIQNGLLQKDYSGLVYFNDNWFYVEEGVLTYQYFGMVEYQGNMFYVQASHLKWDYTGLGYHEGNWYFFMNALYMPEYNGMVEFNGGHFYVENGLIDWTVNGLREFEGKLYYFVSNAFDETFNGTAEYEGVEYTVVNGVVEL